jgi:hypothetical protein
MRDTRRFVESRLKDLSALCDGEPRIAREEIDCPVTTRGRLL